MTTTKRLRVADARELAGLLEVDQPYLERARSSFQMKPIRGLAVVGGDRAQGEAGQDDAHQDDDEMRRIYNRALYLPERKKLLQDWADLMDSFKKPKMVRRAA